jgi:hypothetical protein
MKSGLAEDEGELSPLIHPRVGWTCRRCLRQVFSSQGTKQS